MNINLENISGHIENAISPKSISDVDKTKFQLVKNWLLERNSQLKPWRSFCNTKNFSKPKNASEITKRLIGNIKIYQGNYVAVSVMLILYCM